MWSFHRVLHLLLLPTLCLAEYPKIDDELIAKAKAGQWIYLGDEDDTMIKIVRMQNVFHKDISYGEAEQFCEEDRGHLLSVRSQEEDTYISGNESSHRPDEQGNFEIVTWAHSLI
ncbi:hypothetical protein COOONC_26818 [Cooperia oncophora]